jgi:hypothetical protein
MMLGVTQAHFIINAYKNLAYGLEYISTSITDPLERLKLLTAISSARQVESPINSRGMPPIPIPVGGTLDALLANGALAHVEHLGPKMINS